MRTRQAFVPAALLSAMIAFAAPASAALFPITSITGPTGTAGINYNLWKQTGLTLSIDNTEPIASILAGTAAAPGGNAELFANSENGSFVSNAFGGAFQTVTRTSISGTVNSNPITVSSLNGDDLFYTFGVSPVYDTTYSPLPTTLARKWFKDFFDYYNFDGVLSGVGVTPGVIAAEKAALYSSFSAAGQFARISDPNVSYVYLDDYNNHVNIGLAGSQAYIKTFIISYIAASPNLTAPQKAALIGDPGNPTDGIVDLIDIQASELIRVQYAGHTWHLYGFFSTPTGLSTTDPTESYGRNFNLVIPEPASLALLSLGSLIVLRRRR